MSKDQDHESCPRAGWSRRQFLTTAAAGAAGGAVMASSVPAKETPSTAAAAGEWGQPVTLLINGQIRRLMVEPRWTLLHVLRDQLGLTGTKQGCERGECGACTVLLNDVPHYACLMLAMEAEGKAITTLEGLMQGEELGEVQQAFREEDALQCGYCTPGQIMAAEGLLRQNPDPSSDEIREGMSGNLCRCGTYVHIVKAVTRAAAVRKGGS